jgi:guanosine-3',5'-bis(diphosphate) 3'-pyrophosphohydrolase
MAKAVAEVTNLEELVKKVQSYNPGADTDLLNRAYFYACEAHGVQTRQEGTPYMAHPLAVASILADMKMDVVTIAAAMLHDTVEDTLTKSEDIKKLFGYELGFLVESLTKLSQVEFKSREIAQAENFRRMLLSMAEDIRVILIKFADRLHNMRTLEYLPENKRMRIAQETLEIYAPLANRLGIGWIKTEFEDLSFKYLMPKLYQDIARRVRKRRSEQKGYVRNLIKTIDKKLGEHGLPGEVEGRVKHYYGIYQKMRVRGVPFDQIHDVLGIRIITDTKANCYAILGLIHSIFKPVPGKFKDYIGVPKSNMYQSLHTTVVGPDGERVEFQIRTEEMHTVSEEGVASHWRYKEKAKGKGKGLDDRYVSWLRELVQAQKEEPDAREFLAAVKAEVVPDVIYVFTPGGDIKDLPVGSTPVDFAYSIHTEVGHRCVGARVDGKMVPLRHRLESGSTVEIITSQSHTPSRDWLKFVVTQRAKGRIKQWIKTEERKQSIALGVKLLEDELRRKNLSPSLLKGEEMEQVAKQYNFQSLDDLFVAVGYGKISQHRAVNRLAPGEQQVQEAKPRPSKPLGEHKGIAIKGVDDVLYHTAKCCFPVPGDNLVGFITRGKGVTVHRADCQSLERLATDKDRLVEVDWMPKKDSKAYARLMVSTVDRPGIMANLTTTISGADVNISRLEVTTTPERTARMVFVLEVQDRQQLQRLINRLIQMEGVLGVSRH